MKGKILAVEEDGGIILGDDDKRYNFKLSEWKEKIPPQKGAEVDFEIEDEYAKNIYFIIIPNYTLINDIESNTSILGGVGTIFLLLGWIPYIGFIFYLAGLVMISIALKRISDMAKEKEIFKKWIISIILGFIAISLFFIAFFILIGLTNNYSNNDILFGSILIIGYLIFITLQIVLGILYKQIFYGVYDITNEKLFKTAGNMFFWGGILSIIFIGGILFFIGWIIIAVAFFSIKTTK